MSASTSCSELLKRLRGWDDEPTLNEVRAVADNSPDEFFRDVIEPLSDSFAPRDVKVYERIMRAWISPVPRTRPIPPANTKRVYVLSRVTLGSDIKITSVILDAAKKRYPDAEVLFVGNRKSAELFAADGRVRWSEANYPRSGPMETRLAFLSSLQLEHGIVIDPDSRITQLGLALPCDPAAYFHFPSRLYRHNSNDGLASLASQWMSETFGQGGVPYLALHPSAETIGLARCAAVSLGVGGNATKRFGSDFEANLLAKLGQHYASIFIDRGAGGEERRRVDQAVEASGIHPIFCEGSFAEFAAVIAQSDAYFGYDSAGQHAAAALGVPLTTIFRGAPNPLFRARWTPEGNAPIRCLDADVLSPAEVLRTIDW